MAAVCAAGPLPTITTLRTLLESEPFAQGEEEEEEVEFIIEEEIEIPNIIGLERDERIERRALAIKKERTVLNF